MQIIAHRGVWDDPGEKNSLASTKRAVLSGYGLETDIRDRNGTLVVSHDPATDSAIKFDRYLEIAASSNIMLALNIKSDGIGQYLKRSLDRFDIENYFVFDMSIPEMFNYWRLGLKFYTHISDLCRHPPALENAAGIWLDCFNSLWYDTSNLKNIISLGLPVCVVSEELHSRENLQQWEILKKVFPKGYSWQLCTDLPNQAKEFFE